MRRHPAHRAHKTSAFTTVEIAVCRAPCSWDQARPPTVLRQLPPPREPGCESVMNGHIAGPRYQPTVPARRVGASRSIGLLRTFRSQTVFLVQNALASNSPSTSEAETFRWQVVFLHQHQNDPGSKLLGRSEARSARCGGLWRLRCPGPSDEPAPQRLPLSPPKRASRRLCLCFHETCANQSETETARKILASSKVASEFAVRSERSRTHALRTRVSPKRGLLSLSLKTLVRLRRSGLRPTRPQF